MPPQTLKYSTFSFHSVNMVRCILFFSRHSFRSVTSTWSSINQVAFTSHALEEDTSSTNKRYILLKFHTYSTAVNIVKWLLLSLVMYYVCALFRSNEEHYIHVLDPNKPWDLYRYFKVTVYQVGGCNH